MDFWVEPKRMFIGFLIAIGFILALIAILGVFDSYFGGWGKQVFAVAGALCVFAADGVRRLPI